MLPGLWKIDGYTTLIRQIKSRFDIQEGKLDEARPANYFEFAYDWRRDNRFTARWLADHVDQRLREWQLARNNPDARVILVAHSMGGLIARYYLEVLGGAEHCRALYTFGTPFKGSINALNCLMNGYKTLLVTLFKDVLRTFTSVYELLPVYRAVKIGGQYEYIAQLNNLDGMDKLRFQDGNTFLREILDAVERNGNNRPYSFVPIVGMKQRTFQSMELAGNRLVASYDIPDFVPKEQDGGDGTVPRISATPDGVQLPSYVGERHSSLQNHSYLIDEMIEQIIFSQQRAMLSKIRTDSLTATDDSESTIALELEDLYERDEPVMIRASVINSDRKELTAYIERVDRADSIRIRHLKSGDLAHFADLDGGLYRIRVRSTATSGGPQPVHDIFEVVR